jgi:hypothetical protein
VKANSRESNAICRYIIRKFADAIDTNLRKVLRNLTVPDDCVESYYNKKEDT